MDSFRLYFQEIKEEEMNEDGANCLVFIETETGKRPKVFLLADVPDVQVSAVAGGRNFTSLLPSCAIQRGTNFFF